jgi:hypothetical protein
VRSDGIILLGILSTVKISYTKGIVPATHESGIEELWERRKNTQVTDTCSRNYLTEPVQLNSLLYL